MEHEISSSGEQLGYDAAKNPMLPFRAGVAGFVRLISNDAGWSIEQETAEPGPAHNAASGRLLEDPRWPFRVGIAPDLHHPVTRDLAAMDPEQTTLRRPLGCEARQRKVCLDSVPVGCPEPDRSVMDVSSRNVRVVERSPRAVLEGLGSDAIVMHVDRDLFVRLNVTGRWLWDELDRPRDVDDLVAALVARFPDAAGRADADVDAFVRAMADRDLLLVA
jgi:hypothetical protein